MSEEEDIVVTFKVDRKGNFYINFEIPEPEAIGDNVELARYVAGMILSIHSSSTLDMTLKRLKTQLTKNVQLHLYESILMEITRANSVVDRPVVGPRDVFNIYKAGMLGN